MHRHRCRPSARSTGRIVGRAAGTSLTPRRCASRCACSAATRLPRQPSTRSAPERSSDANRRSSASPRRPPADCSPPPPASVRPGRVQHRRPVEQPLPPRPRSQPVRDTGDQLIQCGPARQAWPPLGALLAAPPEPQPPPVVDRQMLGQDPVRLDPLHVASLTITRTDGSPPCLRDQRYRRRSVTPGRLASATGPAPSRTHPTHGRGSRRRNARSPYRRQPVFQVTLAARPYGSPCRVRPGPHYGVTTDRTRTPTRIRARDVDRRDGRAQKPRPTARPPVPRLPGRPGTSTPYRRHTPHPGRADNRPRRCLKAESQRPRQRRDKNDINHYPRVPQRNGAPLRRQAVYRSVASRPGNYRYRVAAGMMANAISSSVGSPS